MKIAIIGFGYVGQAMTEMMLSNYDVLAYDPSHFPNDLEGRKNKINSECKLAIICVPTPKREDGSCDTSIVEETLEWLDTPLILIKSTVPPFTTQKLSQRNHRGSRICFSPEYMGESTYFTPPWKYPDPVNASSHGFMVIGGYEPARSEIVDIFQAVMGPHTKIHKMTSTEAELVKYFENAWGMSKVTLVNEFYEISRAFGADWDIVREGWLADPRIERMHTMVVDHKRGSGGKCWPKDIHAIVKASRDAGYNPKLLQQVIDSNDEFSSDKMK